MVEEAVHARARKRVEELRRFYLGVVVYAVVNLALLVIDASDGGVSWFFWPLGIWGAFVLIDGLTLFLRRGPLGEAWVERKIREHVEREQAQGRAHA